MSWCEPLVINSPETLDVRPLHDTEPSDSIW